MDTARLHLMTERRRSATAAYVSLLAVLGPVAIALGTAFATGQIRGFAVLPVVIGALLLDLGANLSPGYFHLRSESARRQAFSVSRHHPLRLWATRLTFLIVLVLALYLVLHTGAGLLLLIACAVAIGILYRSPPARFRPRGRLWGLAFLLMGPGLALGAFYALTGSLDLLPAIAAIPSGLVTAAALGVRRAIDRTGNGDAALAGPTRLLAGLLVLAAVPLLTLLVATGALPRGCLAGVVASPWAAILLFDLARRGRPAGALRTRTFTLSLGLALLVAVGAVIG